MYSCLVDQTPLKIVGNNYVCEKCKNEYIIDENYSFDNTHITEPNFYANTLKNIILYFENKS